MSEIVNLKNSRSAFKGHLTKALAKTEQFLSDIQSQSVLSDTERLEVEARVADIADRFGKYEQACHSVCSHAEFTTQDDDADYDKLVDKEFKLRIALKSKVSGAGPTTAHAPSTAGSGSNLPKFSPQKPPTIDPDIDLKFFSHWVPKWNVYSNLMELDRRPRELRVQAFWDCLSGGFITIVRRSIGIQADTTLDVDQIIQRVRAYLRSIRNTNLDWRNLLSLRQKDGQTYDSLCNELLELGDYADTATVTTDRLHTAILILSIRSETDRQKLIEKDPPLNFAESRKFILTLETARKDAKQIGQNPNARTPEAAAAKGKTRYHKEKHAGWSKGGRQAGGPKGAEGKGFKGGEGNSGDKCGYCGYPGKHARDKCPASERKCNNCGKMGHFGKVCKARTKSGQQGTGAGAEGGSTSGQSSANTAANASAAAKQTLKVKLFSDQLQKPIDFDAFADTGADITLMGTQMFNRALKKSIQLKPSQTTIRSVERKPLKVAGQFAATISAGGKDSSNIVYVCDRVQGLYLSLDVCKELEVVHEKFPEPLSRIVASAEAVQPQNAVWPDRDKWINELPDSDEISGETFEIVRKTLSAEYSTVFDDSKVLKPMKGDVVGQPMHIHLKPNAVPYAIHVARQVPLHQRDKAAKAIKEMEDLGVIVPVGDVPTKWCHPALFPPKPNGGIRVVTDLTRLNSQVDRTAHHIHTPAEAVAEFDPDDEFFAKIDLVKGYWQMPLDEESSWLTVFITPFGKFRYLRSPMGFVSTFVSTGDSFCFRSDMAFSGLPVRKVVDDCALGSKSFRGLVKQLCDLLERCAKFDITVNLNKSTFCGRKIKFVGYEISKGSIATDEEKVRALSDFPTPASRTDLRSFVGLAHQLGSFVVRLAEALTPLRHLLKTKNDFRWLPEHTKAFETAKKILTSPPVRGIFMKGQETVLQTDASRLNGLGYALLQKQGDEWRLIECGSRFLKDAESRYAMVELESLAIQWAVQKCKYYLAGIEHFTVVTDHKPLERLYNAYALNDIENARVQNHRTKLTEYSFSVVWKKGKSHVIPDALSRAPVDNVAEDQDSISEMAFVSACAVETATDGIPDLTLEEFQKRAASDERYQFLIKALESGSVANSTDNYVRQFKKVADELSVDNGLILRGTRIVVPPTEIKHILEKLHANHAGIERTKQRAREIVFWPGMSNDIKQTVETCWKCQEYRPSQVKEPLNREFVATRPFQIVSADFFQYGGRQYLVYVDQYSNYPMVSEYYRPPTASMLIKTLQHYFAFLGVPNILRSDNGPQFSAELTRQFLCEWGVVWKASSPHYPQGNGHAEVTVKKIKYLLSKTGGSVTSNAFNEGLLELRNTPMEDGLCPAQRVFGRKLRTVVPTHRSQFDPVWKAKAEAHDRKLLENNDKAKDYYDATAKDLPDLKPGDVVLVQSEKTNRWDTFAKVIQKGKNRRFWLRFPSGRLQWRNRRFLRKVQEQFLSPDQFIDAVIADIDV